MDKNTIQSSKINYTGGVRSEGGNGPIKRFYNPKDAYNDLYSDIHYKLNHDSSWTKPSTKLSYYISKFAPKEDSNDPNSYTSHMVKYFNSKGLHIDSNTTLGEIKNSLIKLGLDPEHEFTKAHLQVEDPSVLKALNIK